jgi:hypothetical protein
MTQWLDRFSVLCNRGGMLVKPEIRNSRVELKAGPDTKPMLSPPLTRSDTGLDVRAAEKAPVPFHHEDVPVPDCRKLSSHLGMATTLPPAWKQYRRGRDSRLLRGWMWKRTQIQVQRCVRSRSIKSVNCSSNGFEQVRTVSNNFERVLFNEEFAERRALAVLALHESDCGSRTDAEPEVCAPATKTPRLRVGAFPGLPGRVSRCAPARYDSRFRMDNAFIPE